MDVLRVGAPVATVWASPDAPRDLDAAAVADRPDLAAYYYVTLPDPSWPEKEQTEYVMSRGEIVSTSVHEVFPGH